MRCAVRGGPRGIRRSREPDLALVTARIRQPQWRSRGDGPGHSFADEEFSMTDTAGHLVPGRGNFVAPSRPSSPFCKRWNTPASTMSDRIERLGREVGRLEEELRQSRDPGQSMLTTVAPLGSNGEGVRNRWSIAFLRAPSPSFNPQPQGMFRATARVATEGQGRSLLHSEAMDPSLPPFRRAKRVRSARQPDAGPRHPVKKESSSRRRTSVSILFTRLHLIFD